MFKTRIPSAVALALSLAGCPTTNGRDASDHDAFVEPELLPGIPNDAQICELTMRENRRRCAYQLAPAEGVSERPLRCVDGSTYPAFADVEQCVATGWAGCEAGPGCTRPLSASARCGRSTVEICLSGSTPALVEEQRVNCAVETPPGCTIDRSRAYREP